MNTLRHLSSGLCLTALVVAGCGGGSNTNRTDGGADLVSPARDSGGGGGDMTKPASGACDPLKQNCTDPNNTKCTITDDGTGQGVATNCVAPGGTKGESESCMRTGTGAASIGMDNCAKGYFCSGIGSLAMTPMRHCRKFCDADTACGAKQGCSSLTQDVGLCIPKCALFGTDCAAPLNCSNLVGDIDGKNAFTACRQPGTGAAGATCKDDFTCGADLICTDPQNGGTCAAYCDASHACKTGKCTAITGLPNTGGACQ